MKQKVILSAALILIILATVVYADNTDYTIRLKSRSFLPPASANLTADLDSFAGKHALIQTNAVVTRSERINLAAKGIHLLKSLSGNTWLAKIDNREFTSINAVSQIRWVGTLRPEDKIEKSLANGKLLPHSEYENGLRVLDIGLHKDVPVNTGRLLLEQVEAVELDYAQTTNSFIAAVDPAKVNELAGQDEISWVSEAGVALSPTLNLAKPAVGADVANQPPYSVTGQGVKAFILDGGTVSNHQDIEGRITVSGVGIPDMIGHPTHVGCTVGGNGSASGGLYEGMAPDVQIITSSVVPGVTLPPMYDTPGNMENSYKAAIQDHGATVSNNSIGSNIAQFGTFYCDKEGDYERTAQLIDEIVGEKLGRITIVWANGNERQNNDGACGNAYNTTAPPATAKNPIAVGAVNKEDLSMTEFSSWGPTDDGRIRPDISAPGCALDNTSITSCAAAWMPINYIGMCGTSMACPVVTGSVALLQEYWRKQIDTEDAWASTMKALVIHGSAPVGADGPDFVFGYGNLDVPSSLDLIDEAVIIEDSIEQGKTYSVDLIASGGDVKVTLVWTDPAGERLAQKVLVNDLDLSVVSGKGTELPWVLDPANPSADATKGVNERDPVEQVELSASAGETLEIAIDATTVPEGPQAFSLVVTGVGTLSDDDDDDSTDDDDATDDDDTTDDDSADDDDNDDDDDEGCGC